MVTGVTLFFFMRRIVLDKEVRHPPPRTVFHLLTIRIASEPADGDRYGNIKMLIESPTQSG